MISIFSLLILAASPLLTSASSYKAVQGHYGTYSVIPGYFKQDLDSTNVTTFDYNDNLGLYDNITWTEFESSIEELNANAPLNTSYKVIYFARHAEGYHNAAQTYFGDDAWDCYYSTINGNGTVEWGPDAYLTNTGLSSAKNNSKLIKSLIPEGFPLPQSFYSSPFTRCADTLVITWGDIVLDTGYATPVFKESLRETIGAQTCNERRDQAYLAARYPGFEFEANFAAEDILWKPDVQETSNGQFWRSRQFLDDLFTSDENTFISVTAHSGTGAALLRAAGHRTFSLSTGAIIPLVVKRVSSLDFNPINILSLTNVTVGASATVPTCESTLSITTVPSSIATSETSVYEASIYTVTTVFPTTAVSNSTTTLTP